MIISINFSCDILNEILNQLFCSFDVAADAGVNIKTPASTSEIDHRHHKFVMKMTVFIQNHFLLF